MTKEFTNYLFDFWKYNYQGICDYCLNKIECKGEDCPNYENYGNKGFFVCTDGTQSSEQEFSYDMTCEDINYGDCPMLENTPCHGCIENNMIGFSWNNVVPNNYDCI